MPVALDECDNCGRKIGKLETPHVWRQGVVCGECHARLSRSGVVEYARPRAAEPPPPPVQVELTAKRWKLLTLIGSLAAVAGTVMGMVGLMGNPMNVPMVAVGGFLLAGGFITALIGRFCAWWFHG
jgi:hypothetical protein